MRIISFCAVALLLAGCADMPIGGLSGGTVQKPKSIVVSDFVVSSEVAAVDRGYTARLERKIGQYPTFERKQRTIERVNDEIVATIVVTLREAGLEAQPGSEEALTPTDDTLVVNGRLRGADPKANPATIGFGAGHGGVVAEMTLSHLSNGGKRQLTTFVAEPAKKSGATPAARNAAIMTVVATAGSPPERLSPDVEGPARAIGRAAGEKIVAFAREQGWLEKVAEAPASEKPAKPQQAKPKQQPKPADAQSQDANPSDAAAVPPKPKPAAKPKPATPKQNADPD